MKKKYVKANLWTENLSADALLNSNILDGGIYDVLMEDVFEGWWM